METINKLLKKQAPKTNRKGGAAGGRALTPDDDEPRAHPVFVRWVNTKDGSCVAVPGEVLWGPSGSVFARGGRRLGRGKMV